MPRDKVFDTTPRVHGSIQDRTGSDFMSRAEFIRSVRVAATDVVPDQTGEEMAVGSRHPSFVEQRVLLWERRVQAPAPGPCHGLV